MPRDDIGRLNLPQSAKRYVRRSGLKSMARQPRDYLKMVRDVLGMKDSSFKSHDAVGKVKHSSNVIERIVCEFSHKIITDVLR